MYLMRYTKRAEATKLKFKRRDSSEFVAFWSDSKYVFALDMHGEEWMLTHHHTLIDIEEGDSGLVRTHRGILVRGDAIERVVVGPIRSGGILQCRCIVRGREFVVSRRFRTALIKHECAEQAPALAVAA